MNFYGWILFFHVFSASVFAMTMVIMQLVVANVMKRIPDGPGKKDGVFFIQKRWHPVVDGIIVVVGGTALLLFLFNWRMIFSSPLLETKVVAGAFSLCAAYANHFYFRYVKRSLAATQADPKRLQKLNRTTAVLDKVALTGGIIAVLLGWYWGHVG